MTDLVIVLTTISEAHADSLAAALIDERLAACVNIHPPMQSVYRWKGRVERDGERQLFIKTTTARLEALERRLHQLHPYELPEFIVVRPERADLAYERWVRTETSEPA